MTSEAQSIYEFGTFRLDAAKRLLLRDGKIAPLTPKCFDILLALLESSGEVVSKDDLMKQIWPDSFVEEGNLTFNISMLRKALGEKASEHQFIVTIPGQGYRFVADVKRVGENLDEVRLDQKTIPPPAHRSFNKVAISAALFIVLSGPLAYWIVTQRKPVAESRPAPSVRWIAVLPFKLVGVEENGSEMEILSDGLSESLRNSLSQMPGLRVIAHGSSVKYKSKDADPQELARTLGVDAIVTGRLALLGDKLMISTELTDTRDNTQMWGDQYDRNRRDLLSLKSEIAGEIARELRLKLTTAEQQQLARRETVSPEAYELLLTGQFHARKGGTGNILKGVEYFNQAIAVDPDYAVAYASLSMAYGGLSAVDPKEFRPKALAAAAKALDLDDKLDQPHIAMANLYRDDWDWAAAESEYKRAIELNPNLMRARNEYSDYLSYVGRHEQALVEIERARELDPLNLHASVSLGNRLFLARRYDEAIAAAKRVLELDPSFIHAHNLLGLTYSAMGKYREAIIAIQESKRLGGTSSSMQIYLGAAYVGAGQREKAQAILRGLQTSKEYVSPGELPVLHVALGQHEEAFASLERAYAEHDLQLQYLGVEPAFDPIRSDPRFQNLMRRVGLPQ